MCCMTSQNALLTHHIYQVIWQQILVEEVESCTVNYHILFWGQKNTVVLDKEIHNMYWTAF